MAPEVFEEMQLYMNCVDPEERRIREFRMKNVLSDLSKDPTAQRSCLRLESQQVISTARNTNVGRVFYFRLAEHHRELNETENIRNASSSHGGHRTSENPLVIQEGNKLMLSTNKTSHKEATERVIPNSQGNIPHQIANVEGAGDFNPLNETTGFVIG